MSLVLVLVRAVGDCRFVLHSVVDDGSLTVSGRPARRAGVVLSMQPFSVRQLLLCLPALYLLRFQIVVGLLLSVVLPVLYFEAPSIFIGIFDALGFISFIFVVWAALQLAWTVMITSRMIFVYGPDRYDVLGELVQTKNAEAASSGTIGRRSPVLDSRRLFRCVSFAFNRHDDLRHSQYSLVEKIIGTVLGVLLSVLVLWLTAKLHVWIEQGPGPHRQPTLPSLRFAQDK